MTNDDDVISMIVEWNVTGDKLAYISDHEGHNVIANLVTEADSVEYCWGIYEMGVDHPSPEKGTRHSLPGRPSLVSGDGCKTLQEAMEAATCALVVVLQSSPTPSWHEMTGDTRH